MALSLRSFYRNSYYLLNITKPVKCSAIKNYPVSFFTSGIGYHNNQLWRTLTERKNVSILTTQIRCCSRQGRDNGSIKQPDEPVKKPGIIQRFKEMYRDYWYVLLPVHMTTSAVWFGSFYYTVSSGVDILSMMESLGVSEKLVAPLRDSSAGFFALAFALYKMATPLRYAVTVGGTTYAIRKLTAIGWIKPVPSRERLKEILQSKKENLQDRFNESRHHYQIQMKEKRTQVMDEMRRYKTDLRNIKNKVKKM